MCNKLLILSFIPFLFRKYSVSPPLSCRCDHRTFTCPEKMPQRPMMTRTLKTADPTIVPTPTSPFVINTPQNIEQERVSNKLSAKSSSIWQSVGNERFYLPLIHRSVQSYTYYLFHLNRNNNITKTSLDRNLGNVLCVSATDCDAFSA